MARRFRLWKWGIYVKRVLMVAVWGCSVEFGDVGGVGGWGLGI